MRQAAPDTILHGGAFLSLNRAGDIYRSIAVKNGIITHVARDDSLLAMRGFGTGVVDLQGRTVVPGFIDSNVHAVQTGTNHYNAQVDANTLPELLATIRTVAGGFMPGEPIWFTGLSNSSFGEGGLTRWELDKVSAGHPVIISVLEFHTTVVNTQAYNLLEIPASINGVEKDGADMPTGVLRGEASGLARGRAFAKMVDEDLRKKGLDHTMRLASAHGITTMSAMEGGFFFCDADFETVWKRRDDYPVDIVPFLQTADVEEAAARGVKSIGGNLYVDGTLGSRGAALYQPYEGDPDNTGSLYFSQEDLNTFVEEAHRRGMHIALSCIGERAIGSTLEAYERAFQKHGMNGHRHRIEHFVLPTDEQIARCASLGIILSMQPGYDAFWGGEGGMYARRIGERWRRANPIGKCVRMGALVAGSSESDVTPLDPLLGVHNAVNHHVPEYRLPVADALKMYTVAGANANFMENRVGKIETGLYADLCVLDDNPMEAPPASIKDITVLQTYKRGRLVYEAMNAG